MLTARLTAALLLALCTAALAQEEPASKAAPASRPTAASVVPPAPSNLRGTSLSTGPGGLVQAPKMRLVLNNLLVLRLNPVGLEDQIRFGYQQRLSDRPGRLFADTFVFLGIAPKINPAFVKIGPSIEIQPLSIFNLRLAAEYIGLFSTFGFLQSYTSATEQYNDVLLRDCSSGDPAQQATCNFTREDGTLQTGTAEKRNYSAGGAHVMIEPLLQAKLGPIALRNKMAFEYWAMDVRGGDRVFYDVTLDTLVPARGWVMTNDLDVLYVSKFGLTAGVRYSVVKPLYSVGDFRDDADRDQGADNSHQRIGPMLAYTFFDRGFTRFNKPTLLLIANWYVSHRYRTGAERSGVLPGVFVGSPAMPYVILGFAFQSDLIKAR